MSDPSLAHLSDEVLKDLITQMEAELSQRRSVRSSSTAQPAATPLQGSITKDMLVYETGAKRSERKPRYDLIPAIALTRLARRFTGEKTPTGPSGGALKYGEGNWERGLPTSDVINHTVDHLCAWVNEFREKLVAMSLYGVGPWPIRMSAIRDSVRGFSQEEDHLAAAMWGISVLMYQEDSAMFHDTAFEKGAQSEKALGNEAVRSVHLGGRPGSPVPRESPGPVRRGGSDPGRGPQGPSGSAPSAGDDDIPF